MSINKKARKIKKVVVLTSVVAVGVGVVYLLRKDRAMTASYLAGEAAKAELRDVFDKLSTGYCELLEEYDILTDKYQLLTEKSLDRAEKYLNFIEQNKAVSS